MTAKIKEFILPVSLINEATGSGDIAAHIVQDRLERHRADAGQIYVYTPDPASLPSLAEAVGLHDENQLEAAWEFPGLTIYRANYSENTN